MRRSPALTAVAVVVLLAGLLSTPAAAATDPAPTRVVLTVTADPSSSQHVSWRTRAAYAGQRIEVRRLGTAAWRTVRASRKPRTHAGRSGSTWPQHTALLAGLSPGTTYEYRVRHARAVSPTWRFTTTRRDHAPFSILALGDTQVGNAGVGRRIVAAGLRARPRAALVLHAGDTVDDPTSHRQWSELFTGMGAARVTRPWAIAIGNHEQCRGSRCSAARAEGFDSHFRWPRNGWSRQGRHWYRTDVQGVRVVVLDAFGGRLAEQARFLRASLRGNPGRWSVVVVHSGPFSTSPSSTSRAVRRHLMPVLEREGADLVLSGHDHAYTRSHHGSRGPVYATSVSGPQYRRGSTRDWRRGGATVDRHVTGTSTYTVLDVTADRLTYRAVVAHRGRGASTSRRVGQVLDTVTLVGHGAAGRVLG
jgi:hypothetical protein